MTTVIDDELIGVATHLIDRVTDGENHTVAAAVRTADGRIITGVNLYHFTGGPCAELVALANAVASEADPRCIVAVGSFGRGVISPCGRCRQVMLDLWPGLVVVLPGTDGPRMVAVPDLLPGNYRRPTDAEWATLPAPSRG